MPITVPEIRRQIRRQIRRLLVRFLRQLAQSPPTLGEVVAWFR